MSDERLDHIYPGIGRLYCFLARVMLVLISVFVVLQFGPGSRVFGVVSLVSMVAGVVLDVMRLRNIGVSEWLVFLRFIPWVGLLLSIGLQSAQAGWIENKRLDRAGWAIVAVHAAILALIVYLLYRNPSMEIFRLSF